MVYIIYMVYMALNDKARQTMHLSELNNKQFVHPLWAKQITLSNFNS